MNSCLSSSDLLVSSSLTSSSSLADPTNWNFFAFFFSSFCVVGCFSFSFPFPFFFLKKKR